MELPASVPLFPLPNHVMLMGVPSPFRIFEPRYRALAEDLAGRAVEDRWLAIPRLTGKWQADYAGAPAFAPVAALVRALRLEALPDGQWFLLAEGVSRVRLTEITSTSLYRLAQVQEFPDLADDGPVSGLIDRLRAAVSDLAHRLREQGNPLLHLLTRHEDRQVVDHLGALLLVAPDDRQAFLEEPTLGGRARRLLRALGAQRGPAQPSVN